LLTLGISASCVILATADLDIYFRVVKKLGDASYGVYLLHFPAIVLVSKMTTNVFLLFLTGMFFGTLFGLFDHRMYRWLTAPWARPASAPVP
jgi:peptidoglycan/LPS O-acetylase OafA/YrhL